MFEIPIEEIQKEEKEVPRKEFVVGDRVRILGCAIGINNNQDIYTKGTIEIVGVNKSCFVNHHSIEKGLWYFPIDLEKI